MVSLILKLLLGLWRDLHCAGGEVVSHCGPGAGVESGRAVQSSAVQVSDTAQVTTSCHYYLSSFIVRHCRHITSI